MNAEDSTPDQAGEVSDVACACSLAAMPPIVVLVHNPRTGGTGLRRVLTRNYSEAAIAKWWQSVEMEEDQIARDLANPELRAITQKHASFHVGPPTARRVAYITCLRRPVERLVSWYQYQREVNQERAEGLRDPNFEATFEDWAFSGQDREADNGQVRRIAGVNLRYGECNKEHLALAKANLDRYFLLIGLTERYEDTLALANIVLGWRVRNQVVRPRTQCHEPIAPELLERLRALNRYDEELYNYAERRFDRTIKRFRIRHAKLRARLELKGKLRPSDPVLDEELQRLAAG